MGMIEGKAPWDLLVGAALFSVWVLGSGHFTGWAQAGEPPAHLAAAVHPPVVGGPAVSVDSFSEPDRLYFHRHLSDNLEQSIRILEARLKQSPEDPAALWRLGRSLIRMGERQRKAKDRLRLFQRAREALERSTEAQGRVADAHFWLGVAMGRIGQTRGILKSLFLVKPIRLQMLKTLELDPKFGAAHHVLGEIFREVPSWFGGSKERAVQELELAVGLDPDHPAHYPALARAYLGIHDIAQAKATLRKLLEIRDPDDPAEYDDSLQEGRQMLARLESKGL